MKNLKKNQRKMYYALYLDKIPVLDENGNDTFEYESGFADPVLFKASLSIGKSESQDEPFGSDVAYDRTISTVDKSLPIDKHSIIWVRNEPEFNADGSVDGDSADYEVAAPPLDGLNSLLIAIKSK